MEVISFSIMGAGILKFLIYTDFAQKLDGSIHFFIGCALFLALKANLARPENGLFLISLLAAVYFIYIVLILPFAPGRKNRNTEELNDLGD